MSIFTKAQSARMEPLAHQNGDQEEDAVPAPWEAEYDPAEEKAERRRAFVRGFLMIAVSLAVGLAAGLFIAQKRYQGKQVITSINGETINAGDFYPRLESVNGPQLMTQVANETLQLQYAKKLGVAPTDADVEARFREVSAKPHYNDFLISSRQMDTDIKRGIRNEMASDNIMAKGLTLTDADLHAYYAKMTDKSSPTAAFYTPPGITLGVVANVSRQKCEAAAQEAKKGVDWAALAQKYSQDASKNNGGVLKPFFRGRNLWKRIPGMEDRMFSLSIGEQAGPILAGRVWILLHCLAKTPEETQPYESVKYECRRGAIAAKVSREQATKIRDSYIAFQRSANIHTFWPQYKSTLGGR